MEIKDKPTHDPVADIPLSDARLRWLLLAVEDIAGKQGTTAVLRGSNMPELIDAYPPENPSVKGKFTFAEYANINAALLSFFGRGGRSMIARAGRLAFTRGLEKYGPLLGAALAAIRVLPEGSRMKVGLEGLKFTWEKMYKDAGLPPLDIRIQDCGDHFTYTVADCLCCAGKVCDGPMCYLTVGTLQEGLKWLMGKDYDVREIACRAMGAQACVFAVQKIAKGAA